MANFTDILILGSDLSLGENIRVVCPYCGGGSASEKSLSITLGEDDVLRWQCFRNKCDLSPGANGGTPHSVERKPLVKKRKMFEGQVGTLHHTHLEWIAEHWGIDEPKHWYWTPEMGGRIAMSIRSPKYTHRGWVLRDISGQAKTKALTYLETGEESLSWYLVDKHLPTVLVEDIPSAVRASSHVNAVALLGTKCGVDKALEILKHASQSIYIALDQDAQAEAIEMSRRYALLWPSTKVLLIDKDLKDMTEDELCNTLSSLLEPSKDLSTN